MSIRPSSLLPSAVWSKMRRTPWTGEEPSRSEAGLRNPITSSKLPIVDGPGMPDRGLVLKPFHTTKKGHAGLGLNIAARVAQRYRGRVVLGDAPSGALVAIHLQLAKAPPHHD